MRRRHGGCSSRTGRVVRMECNEIRLSSLRLSPAFRYAPCELRVLLDRWPPLPTNCCAAASEVTGQERKYWPNPATSQLPWNRTACYQSHRSSGHLGMSAKFETSMNRASCAHMPL
jgi:hypothetical protein